MSIRSRPSIGLGAGLGLYICCGIIKEHKGSSEIRSVEGEGTAVIVRVPVIQE